MGKLGLWNTKETPDGSYNLFLKVFSTSEEAARDEVSLGIDNNPPNLSFSSPCDGEVVESPFEVKGSILDAFLKRWKLEAISNPPRLLCHFDGNTKDERTGEEGRVVGNPTYEEAKFFKGINIKEGDGVIFPKDKKIIQTGTIELWVKGSWSEEDTREHILLSTKTSNPDSPINSIWLYEKQGSIFFSIYDREGGVHTTSLPLSGANYKKEEPFHIGASWSSSGVALTVNGYSAGRLEEAISLEDLGEIYVGFYSGLSKEACATIDELSIYPYERPLSLIRADFLSLIPKDMGSGKVLVSKGSEPVENSLIGTVQTEDKPGEVLTLRLSARDRLMRRSTKEENVLLDNANPFVRITAPEDGAELSGEVDIKGYAFDMNISSWSLSYKATDREDWIDISSGSENRWNEILATWNTSNLPPGEYELKLSVTDAFGKVSSDIKRIKVIFSGPPVVEITEPSEGSILHLPIQVTGTVKGAGLLSWSLSYRIKGPTVLSHFDESLNSEDGDIGEAVGSPSFESGKFGKGVKIGSQDGVAYPSEGNIKKEEGTVSFWVLPNWDGTDRGTHVLFSTDPTYLGGDYRKNSIMIFHSDGKLYMAVFDNNALPLVYYTSASEIKKGEPFHIGAIWSSDKISFYLNGKVAQRDNRYQGSGILSEVGEKIRIGCFLTPGVGADAIIDEVSIYPFARSENAIFEDFLSSKPRFFFQGLREVSNGSAPVQNSLLGTIEDEISPAEEIEINLSAEFSSGEKLEDKASITIDSPTPHGFILSPKEGKLVWRKIIIEGYAQDMDFSSYALFYKSPSSEEWIPICEGNNPVLWGTLGEWDASSLPNGEYTIRLEVRDRKGDVSSFDREVNLNNDIPTSLITFPTESGGLPSPCEIRGSACGKNFSGYELFYANGHNPGDADWKRICELQTQPVEDGVLYTWDSSSIPEDEAITIRLVVHGLEGMDITYDVHVYTDRTSPEAKITSPSEGSSIGGLVFIEGTANDKRFSSYTLEYFSKNPGEWIEFYSSKEAVSSGTLGYWNTEKLQDGEYSIRLTCLDTAGNKQTFQVASLNVSNPPSYTIESISIYPDGQMLSPGEQKKFICVGKDTQGNSHLLSASWEVEGGVGTIDADGNFTATAKGHGSIRATYETFTATAPVSVVTLVKSTIITEDTTWSARENPWVVDGWIVVPNGVTLTLEPGIVVKFKSGGFYVEGKLNSYSTSGQPEIILTSLKDDSYLGDTNADRDKTSPSPGDWSTVYISSYSPHDFEGTCILYAGKYTNEDIIGGRHVSSNDAILKFEGELSLQRGTISKSAGNGLRIGYFSSLSITNSTVESCSYGVLGISLTTGSQANLQNDNISNCRYGAFFMGVENVTISDNNFSDLSCGAYVFGLETISLHVNGNNFTSCQEGLGLAAKTAKGGIDISGNKFNSCAYMGPAVMVIEETDAETNIYGNEIVCPEENGVYGLMVSPGTNRTNVYENTISGYKIGISAGSFGDVTVRNNTLEYKGSETSIGIILINNMELDVDVIGENAICHHNMITGFSTGIACLNDSNHYFKSTSIYQNNINGTLISQNTAGILHRLENSAGVPDTNLSITSNKTTGFTIGVSTENVTNVSIEGNEIASPESGESFVGIRTGSSDAKSTDLSCKSNKLTGYPIGLLAGKLGEASINSNEFKVPERPDEYPICIDAGTVKKLEVVSNYIEGYYFGTYATNVEEAKFYQNEIRKTPSQDISTAIMIDSNDPSSETSLLTMESNKLIGFHTGVVANNFSSVNITKHKLGVPEECPNPPELCFYILHDEEPIGSYLKFQDNKIEMGNIGLTLNANNFKFVTISNNEISGPGSSNFARAAIVKSNAKLDGYCFVNENTLFNLMEGIDVGSFEELILTNNTATNVSGTTLKGEGSLTKAGTNNGYWCSGTFLSLRGDHVTAWNSLISGSSTAISISGGDVYAYSNTVNKSGTALSISCGNGCIHENEVHSTDTAFSLSGSNVDIHMNKNVNDVNTGISVDNAANLVCKDNIIEAKKTGIEASGSDKDSPINMDINNNILAGKFVESPGEPDDAVGLRPALRNEFFFAPMI